MLKSFQINLTAFLDLTALTKYLNEKFSIYLLSSKSSYPEISNLTHAAAICSNCFLLKSFELAIMKERKAAATNSSTNIELMNDLGADVAIDCKTQDFETIRKNYDVVLNKQDTKTSAYFGVGWVALFVSKRVSDY